MMACASVFQLADAKRNLATESKARHALQRQIQGLTRDLARQQAKEKVLDEELSSFGACCIVLLRGVCTLICTKPEALVYF